MATTKEGQHIIELPAAPKMYAGKSYRLCWLEEDVDLFADLKFDRYEVLATLEDDEVPNCQGCHWPPECCKCKQEVSDVLPT